MFRVFSPNWSGQFTFGRWLPWLITIASLVLILPILYIGIFNHPCIADDYQNARWTSFFGIQKTLYLHWSGRYFNNLALILCPLHWRSIAAYRIAVIAIIIVFALVYMLLIRQGILKYTDAPPSIALAIGAASMALLLNNFPSISEGFYWFSGEVTYVLPAIFAFLLLSILIYVDHLNSIKGYLLAIAGLSAAAAIGGNETMLVLCDLIVAGAWLFYKRQGRVVHSRFYFRLLIICAICSAIAILAPGNFHRQSVNPRNIAMVPPTWLYFSQKAFFQWITDPFLLLFSTLVLILLGRLPLHKPRLNLVVAFLFPFATILLLALPAHYALGTTPPPRVMNVVYTFFLMGWLVFLLHLSTYFRTFLANRPLRAPYIRQAIAIAITLTLLIAVNTRDLRNSNIFSVSKSIAKGIPAAFNQELNTRYQQILSSPHDTVGLVPIVHQQGNPLYLADIISNKGSVGNHHYANYWGKKLVYIDSTLIRPSATTK
jgi:hypothetical protein